jgi:PilZ domain
MHEIRSTILSGEEKPSLVAHKAKAKAAPAGGLSRIAIKRQEARITNQRLEDRHHGIVAEATIVFRRKRRQIGIVNVSSRGAMLAADIEPKIGESLDILFTPETKTRCAVRWVREGRVGIEFVNETIFWETDAQGPVFRYEPQAVAGAEPERPQVEREPRQRLLRSGMLYWGGVSIPVRLRNISSGGARLEADRPLQAGTEVELDLGEAGFQIAEVRWSNDGQVGLRFAAEFDLDSLAPAHEPATGIPSPTVLKPAYLETELQPDSPWAARYERLSLTQLKLVDKD